MNHLGDANKMVDTPRTDEAQFGTGRVSVDFARQLERELNAANDRIKHLIELGLETSEYGLTKYRELWEKEAKL